MRWENLCGEGLCGGEEEKRNDCSGQQIPIALKSSLVSDGDDNCLSSCCCCYDGKKKFCDGIKWLRWPCAEISVARH